MKGAARKVRLLIQEERAQHISSQDKTRGALMRQVTRRGEAGHSPPANSSKLPNSVAMKQQCIAGEEKLYVYPNTTIRRWVNF